MFYYTTAIDKAFLQTSGSGVAFTQMSSMEDVWKVPLASDLQIWGLFETDVDRSPGLYFLSIYFSAALFSDALPFRGCPSKYCCLSIGDSRNYTFKRLNNKSR